MKFKTAVFFLSLFVLTGCSLDSMFIQPKVTVIGYELVGLPGENTSLLVECDIKNMDSHDGDVKTVTYTAVIEGVTSLPMTYSTPFTMKGNQTLRMKLPLTIATADAAILLAKMNAGQGLNFTITGKFTANTFLGMQDLKLNTSGTANVTVGIENFFVQPAVSMNETQGFVITSLGSPPIPFVSPGSPVIIQIKEVNVSNLDAHAATVQKVIYTVTIEGATSDKMTTNYSSPYIPIKGAGTNGSGIVLSNLNMSFPYTAFLNANPTLFTSGSHTVHYTINGIVLIEADLGGSSNVDFYLPLCTSGTNSVFITP